MKSTIEYAYRGFVIRNRGCRHSVPALQRENAPSDFPTEEAACKAIDVALTPRAPRIFDSVSNERGTVAASGG